MDLGASKLRLDHARYQKEPRALSLSFLLVLEESESLLRTHYYYDAVMFHKNFGRQ